LTRFGNDRHFNNFSHPDRLADSVQIRLSEKRDNGRMTASTSPEPFRERLVPGPLFFVALLLLIPGVALIFTPFAQAIAFPIAIATYLVVAASFLFLAPVLEVRDGVLRAGQAQIAVTHLGKIEVLDDASLRTIVGPGADARAHLMLRGYIHTGLRIEITDPSDPTPYWVLTSRKPRLLRSALETGRPDSSQAAPPTETQSPTAP